MTGPCTAEQIARVCHAANTELQRLFGDPSPSVLWDDEPEEIRQTTIAGVEAALRGESPEELHAEWCRNKAAQGWRRGEFKDAEAKTHPCLVPYDELPASERLKDAVFGAIVTAMTGEEPHACGPLLERAQEALAFERERAEKAEEKLGKARELAESWTADDGHGLPTREMVTEADCGREVLTLLGEPAGVPS
jgi:hypothetical protein